MKKKRTKSQKANLLKEVNLLTRQVGVALKAAVKSKEVRKIGQEVTSGVHGVGNRIVEAAQRANKSETAKNIKNQARRIAAVGKKEAKKTEKTLRSNLSRCLDGIGKELQNLSDHLKKM